MEYLVIAYALIAIVLSGYALSIRQRRAQIERARASLEAKKE